MKEEVYNIKLRVLEDDVLGDSGVYLSTAGSFKALDSGVSSVLGEFYYPFHELVLPFEGFIPLGRILIEGLSTGENSLL